VLEAPCLLLRGEFFAGPRRGVGLKRTQQIGGDVRDGIEGRLERRLVRLGGLVDAADLADELQGSGADLAVGDGRIEVEEEFYVAAHKGLLIVIAFTYATITLWPIFAATS
jgi:hypothetical protein